MNWFSFSDLCYWNNEIKYNTAGHRIISILIPCIWLKVELSQGHIRPFSIYHRLDLSKNKGGEVKVVITDSLMQSSEFCSFFWYHHHIKASNEKIDVSFWGKLCSPGWVYVWRMVVINCLVMVRSRRVYYVSLNLSFLFHKRYTT